MTQRYSQYEVTGNKAIDMVAEAVGYARARNADLVAIRLNPQYFKLFKVGVELMGQQLLTDSTDLFFDGVRIKEGARSQMEPLEFDQLHLIKAIGSA